MSPRTIETELSMSTLSLLIRPTDNGWGVYLSDGQELVRYRGLCAKRLAVRYLQRYIGSVGTAKRSGRTASPARSGRNRHCSG